MNYERALAFLNSGTWQPGTFDYVWWEYYDRIALVSTTSRYQYFAVPLGSGGKQESDTNWQIANQMPESERMAVMYLVFFYIVHASPITQAVFQNIIDLMKNAWFQFKVYNKNPWVQFPLMQAFGNTMPLAITGGAVGDQVTGRAMFNGVYELPIEIPLQAKTTLTVEINCDAAPNANLDTDEIYFFMVGPKYTFGN